MNKRAPAHRAGGRRIWARPATWLVVVALAALVEAPPANADPSPRRLREAIERVLARPELAHAFWGIEVRSLASGELLYERNATKAFRPASVLKLVTTAAALDVFGPEARVRTTLETAGRLDAGGRLLGDVYLVGRGDASLSARFAEDREGEGREGEGREGEGREGEGREAEATEDEEGQPGPALARSIFEPMAETLREAGIRRIEGRLVGHEGTFSGDPQGLDWMREDLDWGYGAPVSALSYADNAIGVTLTPGERPGDPAILDVAPRTSFGRVESTVLTGAPGMEEDIHLVRESASGRFVARLSGLLPQASHWEGEIAVDDPALFATTVLAEVLESSGVTVMGPVEASAEPLPGGSRVIAGHEGEPLARLIAEVNKESQNLHAELLLRRLGLERGGEGTTEAGLAALEEFLDRVGVPRAGWGLKDGSGLSHSNLITPRGLAALLVAMDHHRHAEAYRDSLPVAGVDGTLEDRLNDTGGRLRAKGGTMQSVNTLAGYATTTRHERLVFVIMLNNHVDRSTAARRAIDDIAKAVSKAR